MLPTEFPQLKALITAHYRTMQKEPPPNEVCERWQKALARFPIADIDRAVGEYEKRAKFPASPSHVYERCEVIEAERAKARRQADDCAVGDRPPSWNVLMAARFTLETRSEREARSSYGDTVVNILLSNPRLGYSNLDPRSYESGKLPRAVVEEYKRLVPNLPPRHAERLEELSQ